jgi:ParB family chromosome partitioning protein
MDEDLLHRYTEIGEYEKIQRIFDKLIISIRIIIKKLVAVIETVEDKWILYDTLMQHKHLLHEQIDLLIKERRKYTKNSHILHRSYS